MLIALLWGCSPQLPVRTVPNAVRVMIAHTPSGELDPWLSRVVEAAERGQLGLDDVERIERAVGEVFADGQVTEAEISGLEARWDLPEAEAVSFEMDRLEPETDDLGAVRAWLAAGWSVAVSCAALEDETRCIALLGHRVRMARVRTRTWDGAVDTTWTEEAEDVCELPLRAAWKVARLRSFSFTGNDAPSHLEPGEGELEAGVWHVAGGTWVADDTYANRFCRAYNQLGLIPGAQGALGDEPPGRRNAEQAP